MTYLMPVALFIFILSILYFMIHFPRKKDERNNLIMLHAFKNAYIVWMLTLLVTFILSKVSEFSNYFEEMILVDLLLAHLAYTITAIILNRRM